jgi:hypothetical protein
MSLPKIEVKYIDRHRVVLQVGKRITPVSRVVIEDAVGRLPDNIELAEDKILDYTGEWQGAKLYKSTCRLAG